MTPNNIAEAINSALEQHEKRVRFDGYVCAALTGLCAGSSDAAKDVDFLGCYSVEIAKRAIAAVDAVEGVEEDGGDEFWMYKNRKRSPEPALAEFKVGDRVKVTTEMLPTFIGKIGSVVSVNNTWVEVNLDDDTSNGRPFETRSLEHLPILDVNAQLLEAAEKARDLLLHEVIVAANGNEIIEKLTAAIEAAKGCE